MLEKIQLAVKQMFESAREEALQDFDLFHKEEKEEAKETLENLRQELIETLKHSSDCEYELDNYSEALKNYQCFERDRRKLKYNWQEVEKYLFPTEEELKERKAEREKHESKKS